MAITNYGCYIEKIDNSIHGTLYRITVPIDTTSREYNPHELATEIHNMECVIAAYKANEEWLRPLPPPPNRPTKEDTK